MPEGTVVKAEPLRVLVVDDDEASRALVRVLLGLVESVEIVGEAADGYEAVLLAQTTEPHLVILDVNMPRLDGIAAAEALLAANPHIQLVIHTSEPDTHRLRRAARLGIHINDKADVDGLVTRLETAATAAARTPSTQHRLHTAVLAALLGVAPGQSLVVASPDEQITFYNQPAADFLQWPFPPRPLELAEVKDTMPTFDVTGRRLPPQERPIGRTLATRRPMREEELIVLRDHVPVSIIAGATPLFDDQGEFIGIANYFRTTGRDLNGFSADIE